MDAEQISENSLISYLIGKTDMKIADVPIDADSIITGETQHALDSNIKCLVPYRGEITLAYTSFERAAISLSAWLFGIDCYPTFYGSSIIYDSSHHALFDVPYSDEDEAVANGLASFGESLSLYAQKNIDVQFHVVVADNALFSDANPAKQYVSNSMSTEDCISVLDNSLRNCPNVKITAVLYTDTKSYLQNYYHSDHHWNGYGSIETYNAINDTHTNTEPPPPVGGFDEAVFNGSASRKGLMLLNSPVKEPKINTSNLKVQNGARGELLNENGPSAIKHAGLRGDFNFYSLWYGGDSATIIHNYGWTEKNPSNSLIVADSYGDSIRWLISKRHESTYTSMDLYNMNSEDTLLSDEMHLAKDADTIYFVASPSNYASFEKRHPNYFDGDTL